MLNVSKIPELGDTRKSRVKRPSKKHGKPGQATLDSEDLVQYEGQTPAYHEAGHMLGLGDEYPGKKFKGKAPAHSKLVEAEFGKGVLRGKDNRIMSHGNRGRARARRHVPRGACAPPRSMKEWSFTPKTRRRGASELAPEEPEVAFAKNRRQVVVGELDLAGARQLLDLIGPPEPDDRAVHGRVVQRPGHGDRAGRRVVRTSRSRSTSARCRDSCGSWKR